ncbi:MAG: hypothetical protein ACRC9N_04495, partial [Aeromonas sp.]
MATGSHTLNNATTVTQLNGQLFLAMEDGSRRLVKEGEFLPQGSVVISTSSASFVANGQVHELMAAPPLAAHGKASGQEEEEEEE